MLRADRTFPTVVFSLALIYFGVKTEPNETHHLSGEKKKEVRSTVLLSASCIGWQRQFEAFLQVTKCTPPTEVHLIQHNLTCPCCAQAASAFYALEGDQAGVVPTLSSTAIHAISIRIISPKRAEHITRGTFLLLLSIVGKWHILLSFHIRITSGTNTPLIYHLPGQCL